MSGRFGSAYANRSTQFCLKGAMLGVSVIGNIILSPENLGDDTRESTLAPSGGRPLTANSPHCMVPMLTFSMPDWTIHRSLIRSCLFVGNLPRNRIRPEDTQMPKRANSMLNKDFLVKPSPCNMNCWHILKRR